jgi:hypothetical protein
MASNMKQSRRQELKTNELSVFLKQLYENVVRNLNYVIGGLVVVAALLAIGLYVQHRRQQARETAWSHFQELQRTSVTESPAALDKARELAVREQGNGELGPLSALTAADMADELAMSLDPAKDHDKRLALLRDAKDRYQGVIDGNPGRPALVARARYSLAKVCENLFVAGEGTKEQVRAQYEALLKDPLYGSLAREQLDNMDQRLQPLKVVATRPAEQPATAPAGSPTTQPTTHPAPEATGLQPAEMESAPPVTTRPAVPPGTAPAH